MPRACSINAVVSPPTPPPTMMAFMHATRNATPRAICAPRGTGDQPPGSHTVSGVYEVALTAVNGAENWAGNANDTAVNAVRQALGAARDPQGRERPVADVGRPSLRARGLVPG